MTHNYIHTKEFFEEHSMHQQVKDELERFIGKKVEFTVQGDEYTILAQFESKLLELKSFQSNIESGHLTAFDFFIYLINEAKVRYAIPAHQVVEINKYSPTNIEFDCQLYRMKLRIIE
ncbi:hypothetical protein [Desulfuribacillus alkaliarsenatis]|uniref:Uncharacterized protein n=1 Tax=Desulfuribacillus alkaliarsenatis TaxID=766136 RepID=A0A1E5G3P5_9FIRM|nr:hypothetical protein [Desulfuribacillus alkaliarsenatis]OEF97207.1 hypothetical protein BHF68_14865 [Desulfuribacillus alkaliarsenatis]